MFIGCSLTSPFLGLKRCHSESQLSLEMLQNCLQDHAGIKYLRLSLSQKVGEINFLFIDSN